MAGSSRLDQIRASMAGNQLSGPPAAAAPELAKGTADSQAKGAATPVAEGDADRAT